MCGFQDSLTPFNRGAPSQLPGCGTGTGAEDGIGAANKSHIAMHTRLIRPNWTIVIFERED